MRPVIVDYGSMDPDLPRIFLDRFDHFLVTLYSISYDEGDPLVVTPTYNYIREVWLNLYKEQGRVQLTSAHNWLFDARQIAQAIREFTKGAGQYYESWTRRVSRGHEMRFSHEAITDMVLGESGSRTFRIKPEDLKGILAPHSTEQHTIIGEWMAGWSPKIYTTVSGTPIKWRNDVGAWL